MTDPNVTLERLCEQAQQLYSLPAIAMQVLDLTKNPQVDTHDLKRCIENDPALASKILRVVNSSLFGLSREVSDLGQALALLGIKPLKLLVLGFSLPSGLFVDVEAKTLTWYWRHALTKAVCAREISQRLWRMPGDDPFLAGLFQDLGILLLLQELGRPYAQLLDFAISSRLNVASLEARSLGFEHATLSARLLTHWHFPRPLVDAIAWRPPLAEAPPTRDGSPIEKPSSLAQILHLSELVARLLADGQPEALKQFMDAGTGYHRVLEFQLEPFVEELQEKVEELADVLSLQLPGGMEYRDVLAEAHRQMARVATQVVEDMLNPSRPEADRSPEEEGLLEDLEELTAALSAACRAVAPVAEQPKSPGAGFKPPNVPATVEVAVKVAPPAPPVPVAAMPSPAPSVAVATTIAVTRAPATAGSASTAAVPAAKDSPATPESLEASRASVLDSLARVIAISRRCRRPLSLLLVELAPTVARSSINGEEFSAMVRVLAAVCRGVDHPFAICEAYGDAGFAIMLPDCERQRAIELGIQLGQTVRRIAAPHRNEWVRLLQVATGVATVSTLSRSFPGQDLLSGAERCLFGSRASGGGVVKSIEIY